MAPKTTLVWIRNDLRLADNPALFEASEEGRVAPVFILAPDPELHWSYGAASRSRLHHSLKSFETQLKSMGSRLVFKKGPSLKTLLSVAKEIKADAVYWNRRYEPDATKLDQKIKKELLAQKIECKNFEGNLLYEPWKIKNKQGTPYRVYTAFWNEVSAINEMAKPVAKPKQLRPPASWPKSEKLETLKLTPKLKWDTGFYETGHPGEEGAKKELKRFQRCITNYAKNRDIPCQTGTSRLSAHLHFGEISVKKIWNSISKSSETIPYLRQLVWRDFAHHLLYHYPKTPTKNLYSQFNSFPWKKNKLHLKAWQKGQTGYPIVDAGMRELWHTGWMHNRVRMIVGSFLVKDLLISWQEGARWFWDTLVDADLANNTLGWQWVAGCGADASPFFRIFNPVTQSEKFDPQGHYIRKWVPEVSKLSNRWIHKPWLAPDFNLIKKYPKPIVDHDEARRVALLAYERIKRK